MNKRKILMLVASLFVLSFWGCHDLPGVYSRLPVRWQVRVYGARLHVWPAYSDDRRSEIARHGFPAAEILAEQLKSERPMLPRREAIIILGRIQYYGTDLAGTHVERALQELQPGMLTPAEDLALKYTLDAIRARRHDPTL